MGATLKSRKKYQLFHTFGSKRSPMDLHKELKMNNLKSRLSKQSIKQGQNQILKVSGKNVPDTDKSNKSMKVKAFENRHEIKGDVHFHRATKFLMLYGQFIAINPAVIGIFEDDTSKLRSTYLSLKFLISLPLFIFQPMAFILCWHTMNQKSTINIFSLGELVFYGLSSVKILVFIRIAMNWPSLVKAVAASKLEEYMDARIKRTCNITIAFWMIFSIVEHSLALIARIATATDCFLNTSKDMFKIYTENGYPWIFELGVPYDLAMGIFLQISNTTIILGWNYYDVFITCISFYLTSIFKQINKKIASAKRTKTTIEFWRCMREDYTRASRLVRSFDDFISSIIFVSFAGNLIIICIQLFQILSYALTAKPKADFLTGCFNYPNGPFNGYENAIYSYYSLAFVIGRTIMVSLVTAHVHSTSKMVAPALYELPASVHCDEIQRFIDQVHNDNVAFSGLQFFYVTKEMIFAVAGTIVTYELVLLQYSGDDSIYDD